MNKDILTQGEAVELMQEIIQKENYKYNLDISFGTVKFTNRLKHELNQNQINLEKGFKKWVKAFDIYEYEKSTRAICFCYHSIRISLVTDKHIVFKFLNDIYKRLDILITSYHEFFHALEDKKFADIKDNDLSTTDINFYTFFSIIETMIKHQPEVVNYYKNNHDDFIREMGADLYAIKQTIDKHKLKNTLQEIKTILVNEKNERKIVLAREITKIHEEYIRGTIDKIIEKSEVKKHIDILNVAYHLCLEIVEEKGFETRCICPFCRIQ